MPVQREKRTSQAVRDEREKKSVLRERRVMLTREMPGLEESFGHRGWLHRCDSMKKESQAPMFGPCRSEQISGSIVSTEIRMHQDLVMGWTKRSESRMWMEENKKDLEDSERAGSASAKKAIGRETPRPRDARPRPATKEEVATRREGSTSSRRKEQMTSWQERDRISTRLLYAARAVDRFAKEGAATRVQLERLARERPHPPTTLHTANDTP